MAEGWRTMVCGGMRTHGERKRQAKENLGLNDYVVRCSVQQMPDLVAKQREVDAQHTCSTCATWGKFRLMVLPRAVGSSFWGSAR